MSSLQSAIKNNKQDLALQMIRKGADVNATTDSLKTPLHYLAKYWQPRIAFSLLSCQQLEFDIHDANDRTPLEVAAKHSHGVALARLSLLTNAIQVFRFYERFYSFNYPIFYWTRARNLLSTHRLMQTPLSQIALDSYKKQLAHFHRAGQLNLNGLEALIQPKELKKRWKLILKDDRFVNAKMHEDEPLDPTNCEQTAWAIVHYLAEKGNRLGITSAVDRRCSEGISDLKLLIKEDTSLFFHCFIYINDSPEHTFVIQRVTNNRYRILQSYIDSYTLADLLEASAYPACDLSRNALNTWLDSVQRLCEGEWKADQQRLYRDLFHSSTSTKAMKMGLFFYASNGRTPLMHFVEAGKYAEVCERLKDPNSLDFEVEHVDAKHQTILHLASYNLQIAKHLLLYSEFKKYLKYKDNNGLTPAMYALVKGRQEIFRLFSIYAYDGNMLPSLTKST